MKIPDYEQRLDEVFDLAFKANDPAMLDYVKIKFELKELRKFKEDNLDRFKLGKRNKTDKIIGTFFAIIVLIGWGVQDILKNIRDYYERKRAKKSSHLFNL